ncbi:hypothetical protein Pla108_31550 [Botrimarina colliarenosi]|uniref:Uncharacterized protein n=1 Tax=Botrimarina colliarenosi TaxID=2528001 RepID=A0A5C6ACT1_9BACT|nr:hypothetical protein [Botrimarina colliarenosi]TWT96073.1 hypothetical protein Pla108_31550 [Botrimarina colliarenosi]
MRYSLTNRLVRVTILGYVTILAALASSSVGRAEGPQPAAGVVIASDTAGETSESPDLFDIVVNGSYDGAEEPTNDPTPAGESAVQAIELNDDEIVRFAQALERIPAPTEWMPTLAPSPQETAASGSGLNRPIVTLTLDAAADPELVANLAKLKDEVAIRDASLDQFGSWDAPAAEASLAPARFAPQLLTWAAPAVYTRPLYFEQPNVERYGHYVAVCEGDNLSQSALSAAHFFAVVPALPYAMGASPPDECSYVLGNYRPGSCNPHQLLKPEWSFRGLLFEGLTATGMVFFLP